MTLMHLDYLYWKHKYFLKLYIMATFTKNKLSGSTDGRGIKITSTTSGAADTIHTSVSGTGTNTYDEAWIYCQNTSTTDVKLTILFGGTTSPDDYIEFTVAAEDGLKLIIPGLVLQNSSVIKAFAGTANVLVVHGFVNNITA